MNYPFPKTDLHLHLDGSFKLETFWQMAKERNVKMPADTIEGYWDFIKRCSNAKDVNEYLKMFAEPTEVLQDKDALRITTKELIDHLAKDIGMAYAEIRFAPQLHIHKGLTQSEATEAVLEGMQEGLKENPDIKIGIITCMMSIGPETLNWNENLETIEVCKKYLGKGVVALDLAGAEGIVPLSNFKPLFDKANEYGLPLTCHAGDSQGPDTIKAAMSFGVSRIGHGHHIYDDPELCKVAAEKKIALEICPTSNIQCHTQPSYAEHPAKKLLDMGVPVTINTDNMTLADVSILDEYDHCLNEMGFTYNDLITMNINAIRSAFLDQASKDELIAKLETYYQ